jgi:methionyl-tRNA synthetase
MLKAAELQLPERVWAHGFVLTAGERFSKSSGVRVDLDEVSNKHGVDAFRYFLMREVPFDNDGSFSWERFEERYNSDLANALGNLASRTISMVERYRGGVTPSATGPAGEELDRLDAADIANYHACLNGERGYLLHEALQHVWKTVARGNEFVDRKAPWKLAKDPSLAADLDTTLAALVRQLARHAVHLAPFLPSKMEEMWVQLGAPFALSSANAAKSFELRVDGWRVSKGSPLFPKDVEAK